MLVLEKDYIVIDAEQCPVTIERRSEDAKAPVSQEHKRLRMSFTVQCNGRLKRSVIDFDLTKSAENEARGDSVNGWGITHYDPVYAVFNLLRDLGYDVGDEFKVNEIIMEALRVFEEDEPLQVAQDVAKKLNVEN